MLKQFQSFLDKEQLFSLDDRILLAVSGGLDSMAMVYLFQQAGFEFGIAHCNFQLRGLDSDGDESFVAEQAQKLNIPFHSIRFDTNKEAQLQKTSTQIVARTLRYQWFEELRLAHGYTHIATAHHLNDSLETVLLNLTKGCGIKGLHGIPIQQAPIIRPLLFATRVAIQQFIQDQNIPYREDASNQSTKYQRNLIRHEVVPHLKTINPSLESTFGKTLDHLRETEMLFNEMIEQYRNKITKYAAGHFCIEKQTLHNHPAKHTLLYELLLPYGFNGAQISQLFKSYEQIGTMFSSVDYHLLVDRDFLLVKSRNKKKENFKLVKENSSIENLNNQEFKFTYCNKTTYPLNQPSNTALLDYEQLEFPLTIRYWQEGDRFQPLGMNGRSKKLQDFFSDLKLNRFEKEEVMIVESNGRICWVVGYRIDERFKLTKKTNKVVRIDFRGLDKF